MFYTLSIMKKDYVIWTPAYAKSNGIKVLHLLYKKLEEKRFNVWLYSQKPHLQGYKYIEKISKELKQNAIVVYPEIVIGNPLGFQNVARYVLYYPGELGGTRQFHHSEIIFTHNKKFYPQAFLLTLPWIDETIFYEDDSEKIQDCYFVYKGGKYREAEETKGLLEINMQYPKTSKELADLLRRTKTLYSYDACSSVLDEAVLCGATVKIITQDGIKDYDVNYRELIKDSQANLENFITITQDMNYTGEIEKTTKKQIKTRATLLDKIINKFRRIIL